MPITIETDFAQFPNVAQIRESVQWAVSMWQTVLRKLTGDAGDQTLKIRVINSGADLQSIGLLAMCVPNAIKNFEHVPSEIWYPSALANQIVSRDLLPSSPDMTVFIDLDYNEWNTLNAQPKDNEYDLRSVALHEIGHGLGFVSLFVEAGGQGSLNGNQLKNLIPNTLRLLLGFDLPDFGNKGTVFDMYLYDYNGNALTNMTDPQVLGGILIDTQNAITFQNGPVKEQVCVTDPFKPFTSIMHLDDKSSLMQPSIGPGQRVTVVDTATQKVLERLGWR